MIRASLGVLRLQLGIAALVLLVVLSLTAFATFLVCVGGAYQFLPQFGGWLFLLMAIPSFGASLALGGVVVMSAFGLGKQVAKSAEGVADTIESFVGTAQAAVGTARAAVDTGKLAVDTGRNAFLAGQAAINVVSGKAKLPKVSLPPAKLLGAISKATGAAANLAEAAERKGEAKQLGIASKPKKTARTKVVGVTSRNEDGSDRQDLIARHCKPGMRLALVHEADNPVDPNAVAVYVEAGGVLGRKRRRIGHLKAELAKSLVAEMKAGLTPVATILDVTGGGEGLNRGVNIQIELG